MAGVPRQPFCHCGAPVSPPRLRYCSAACARDAERARRKVIDAQRAPRDRAAYARARYAATKADPEAWAALQAYRRRYRAEHRETFLRHQREWKQRLRADTERYETYLAAERERKRIWAAANPERKLAQQRASYRRLRADPERWARTLETHRLGYRLRAEQAGTPVVPVSEETYERRNGATHAGPRLDPAPLRQLIHEAEDAGWTQRELADASGVSERLLYRVLHEDSRVTAWAADRVLVTLGLHLDLIYEEAA
jgi:hypothetical protein